MPAISIIVPFFDRHSLIGECVGSVVSQGFPDLEIVIVDDGSRTPLQRTDLGAAADDARIRLFRQENLGSGAARNAALQAARGDYVLFLDSDDLLVPDSLQTLWSRAQEGNFDAVVGNWTNFSSGSVGETIRPSFNYGDPLANVVEGAWATGSAILKRSLDPACPEARSRLPWDMAEAYLRALSDEKARIAYVDCEIVMMRQDSSGRLTVQYDHFDPLVAGRFWREMKSSFVLNDERRSAFDRQLFRYAFASFHGGQYAESRALFSAIDADRMGGYHWYRFLSPAWFARWCGVPLGFRLQHLMHRIRSMS